MARRDGFVEIANAAKPAATRDPEALLNAAKLAEGGTLLDKFRDPYNQLI